MMTYKGFVGVVEYDDEDQDAEDAESEDNE